MRSPVGKVLTIIMCSFVLNSCAQSKNIVPNASFEDGREFCGDFGSSEQFAEYVDFWFPATQAVPRIYDEGLEDDCWNSLVASREYQPHNGSRMASLSILTPSNNYRSYLEVPLKKALIIGKEYHVCLSVRLAHYCKLASNNIGILFSDTIVKVNYDPSVYPVVNFPYMKNLEFIPQMNHAEIISDTSWVVLRFSYTAVSNSAFLIIGNFHTNEATKYVVVPGMVRKYETATYLIDSVYVGEVPCD